MLFDCTVLHRPRLHICVFVGAFFAEHRALASFMHASCEVLSAGAGDMVGNLVVRPEKGSLFSFSVEGALDLTSYKMNYETS